MGNLCLECPDSVRGTCCNIGFPIGGFNIVLENVVCPFLDKKTKLCSDYDNRKKIAPWCLHGNGMFGKGGLPKGCLYLTIYPKKEPNPKIKIRSILSQLPFKKQQEIVVQYNFLNNISFEKYISLTLKNK